MAGSREIDAGRLMQFYNDLVAKDGTEGKTKGKSLADMTSDELRAYKTESKRRSRERQRAARDRGSPEPTADNVRAALADAAIFILETDSPGTEAVMLALSIAFRGRAGVPIKIRDDARKGKLRMAVLKRPA